MVFTWVEIPVADINRAAKFYGALLDKELEITDDGIRKTAIFSGDSIPGGSINQTQGFKPHSEGVLVYLAAGDDLEIMLSRVEPAGGKVIGTKESLGEGAGFYAMFKDSEGNTLALYSPS